MPRESGPTVAPEQYTAFNPNVNPEAAPDIEKELDELLKGEETEEEEKPGQETGEVTGDQVKLAWDVLSERERQGVLRGVLHFDSFQRINERLAHGITGNSIEAKTRRHALRRMTAIARLLTTGDPRIAGVLNQAKALAGTLRPTEQDKIELRKDPNAQNRIAGRIKAERQKLNSLMEAHEERLRAQAEAGVEEGEIAPEAPKGPEVLSREMWEHLYAVGFNCIEMPVQEGKESKQEFILYVDPTNPNLDPRLQELFHFDDRVPQINERLDEIQAELAKIGEVGDKEWYASALGAEKKALHAELQKGKTDGSWRQAQEIVRRVTKEAIQSRIDRDKTTTLEKQKLTRVRSHTMDYPTETQGETILKKVQQSFPEPSSIAIYTQQERRGNDHNLMAITRQGNFTTRALANDAQRPVYDAGNTKLFPIMLEINLTRAEIEKMGLGKA